MSDIVSHKIHKALKVRIYPSEDQKVILNKTFGCCRVVYNERLAEHINYYNTYRDNPNRPRFKLREIVNRHTLISLIHAKSKEMEEK